MTPRMISQIIQDYNSGNGLSLKEIAAKYYISYYLARNVLIRSGVYLPQRKIYHDGNADSAEWLLVHAEALLNKVIQRHEGGLLPDRFLYEQIKEYFKTKKLNKND